MEGAVPESADKVTQDWLLLAVQLRVPTPELVMVTVCAAGLGPKTVPDGFRPVVDRFRLGGGIRVRVTVTVCGDPVAPVEVMVTVSV